MTIHTQTTPAIHVASDPLGLHRTQDSTPRSGRIVVGVDGSGSSTLALARGLRIANALNATLEIVTSWGYPDDFGSVPTAENWSPQQDAIDILGDAVHRLFPAGRPDWVSVHPRQGHAADVLIEAGNGAEMLIVGSRGHGGIIGLLLGSVSAQCAERASCPVLVMH
jgi:nucleotide-binding universal stress UspA family protein